MAVTVEWDEAHPTEDVYVHVDMDGFTSSDIKTTLTSDLGATAIITLTDSNPRPRKSRRKKVRTGEAGEPGTLNIGTEFGEQIASEVTGVVFSRKPNPEVMMEITYSDRAGLTKMGVNMDRPAHRRWEAPQAFPGQSCQPPAGWTG